jgi:hypothetical protein
MGNSPRVAIRRKFDCQPASLEIHGSGIALACSAQVHSVSPLRAAEWSSLLTDRMGAAFKDGACVESGFLPRGPSRPFALLRFNVFGFGSDGDTFTLD